MQSLQVFIKQGAIPKIMPPWTLDELEAARPHARKKVSSDVLNERYMKWGGSVRYCLSSTAARGNILLAQAIFLNVNTLFRLLEIVDSNPVRTNLHAAYQHM